jgi:hypothetical protein
MVEESADCPIPQELVAKTKGIYAGLVMMETKCIEEDSNQSRKPYSTTRSRRSTAALTPEVD